MCDSFTVFGSLLSIFFLKIKLLLHLLRKIWIGCILQPLFILILRMPHFVSHDFFLAEYGFWTFDQGHQKDYIINKLWSCVVNVYFLSKVVINWWTYVIALYPVMSSFAPSIGFLIIYDPGAWWCQSDFVEVKMSLHNWVHWNMWVAYWSTEHVQSGLCFSQWSVP